MFVKTKKITLSKILISSSLLLSTIGLPLVLTCCSKKNDLVGPLDQPHHTGYLFKSQPKFFNDKGEEKNYKLSQEKGILPVEGRETHHFLDFYSFFCQMLHH